jgi:3-phenylpropionate/cinnamic acid dioxygenase small subunit
MVEPAEVGIADRDYIEIQRFLYREARLLDRRDYAQWLALLTDDVTYRVAQQVARAAPAGGLDYAIVDEDAENLKARVAQLADPKLTHAENPPSFIRRFVSNLEPSPGPSQGEFAVESNLLVYKCRATMPEGRIYVAARHDVLRRIGGALRIARRDVRLDHPILFDGVVSTLF